MSTVSEIVTQAFREGNFIAVGETPTTEELTEAVPRLRNLLDSLFGFEIGEAYNDWYIPSDFVSAAPLRAPFSPRTDVSVSSADSYKYPPQNSRLLLAISSALTIYFPANPNDGARMMVLDAGSAGNPNVTINGNGHFIDGAATLIADVNTLKNSWWLYRADLGQWVKYVPIVDGTSTIPLPDEFDDLFVCGLAIRFSTRFQTTVDDATVARYNDVLRRIKKRYRQTAGMPQSLDNSLSNSGFMATTGDLM